MLKIARLTVNHFAEAIGLDEAPRFSWRAVQCHSDADAGGRGRRPPRRRRAATN